MGGGVSPQAVDGNPTRQWCMGSGRSLDRCWTNSGATISGLIVCPWRNHADHRDWRSGSGESVRSRSVGVRRSRRWIGSAPSARLDPAAASATDGRHGTDALRCPDAVRHRLDPRRHRLPRHEHDDATTTAQARGVQPRDQRRPGACGVDRRQRYPHGRQGAGRLRTGARGGRHRRLQRPCCRARRPARCGCRTTPSSNCARSWWRRERRLGRCPWTTGHSGSTTGVPSATAWKPRNRR